MSSLVLLFDFCSPGSSRSILASPIFDSMTGFGGDGVPGTYTLPSYLPPTSSIMASSFVGCVLDGPFARGNYTIHLGPGKLITSHCLVRGIDNKYDKFLSSEAVGRAMSQPTFEKFRVELEGTPTVEHPNEHGSGHLVVGGDLGNLYSSPGGQSKSCSFVCLSAYRLSYAQILYSFYIMLI